MLARLERRQPSPHEISATIAEAKPARLAHAENSVRELRDRLAAANAAVRRAIVERSDLYGGSGHGDATGVNAATATVAEVEALLRPARLELQAARAAAEPAIRRAASRFLADVVADLEQAADLLGTPIATIAAVRTASTRLGASELFASIEPLPDPERIRAVARAIEHAARSA